MSEKIDEKKMQELKEMVQEKSPNEPVEKVLTKFCERHGFSLKNCQIYYNRLVEKGEIKKE